jgi:hypothetical protein
MKAGQVVKEGWKELATQISKEGFGEM